jgi:low affinity Fe/Cu permease
MRRFFTWLASRSAYWMGHPASFLVAVLLCVLWAVTGPLFNYSDTWQLVINTATTVLTFLAVFLIQNSQNRDGIAIQAKLDEILIAVSQARTELVGIENMTDAEVTDLKAAIEREALHPDAPPDESAPTVEEILKNRELPSVAEVASMPAAERRDVANRAKAVAAVADKVDEAKKRKSAKARPTPKARPTASRKKPPARR